MMMMAVVAVITGNQTTTVERDVNVTGTMTTGREATDMTSAPPGEWTSDISVPTTISRPITKLDVTTSLSTTLTRRMTSPTSHKPTDYAGIESQYIDYLSHW